MINNTYFTSNNMALKNTSSLPNNVSYFFEGDFTEIINISDNENFIDSLTSVTAFIDIINYKLQKYTKSTAYSGISLPTNKLVVEINLTRHIKYAYKNKIFTSSLANLENSTKIVSIGIPNKICNIPIDTIVRRGELTITPYIENIFSKKITNRSILISISVLINIKF